MWLLSAAVSDLPCSSHETTLRSLAQLKMFFAGIIAWVHQIAIHCYLRLRATTFSKLFVTEKA